MLNLDGFICDFEIFGIDNEYPSASIDFREV